MKTLFIDIDGTLLFHHGDPGQQTINPLIVLPGVINKLSQWESEGYKIILVTGRKKSERKLTKKQLAKAGIQYDKLIMDVGCGERIIINDLKTNSVIPTAGSICVERNEGLKNVEI